MCRLRSVLARRVLTIASGLVVAAMAARANARTWSQLKFQFSPSIPIPGMHCISVNEPSDPDTWVDNYLCSSANIGMRFFSAGRPSGMNCIQVNEPSEPAGHGWGDNWLCVPQGTTIDWVWKFDGQKSGYTCEKWSEPSDHDSWHDNYLCYRGPVTGPLVGVPSECQLTDGAVH